LRAFGASKQAQELQRRLGARAEDASDEGVAMVNWLADWWNEAAYMAFREPVVVNVSYFYVHAHAPDADEAICDAPAAPRRAARLLKAMLPFRTLVETCVKSSFEGGGGEIKCCADAAFSAQLEPEKVRGAPLCMDSYMWL
jgi:carnitine O-acetyltransferase